MFPFFTVGHVSWLLSVILNAEEVVQRFVISIGPKVKYLTEHSVCCLDSVVLTSARREADAVVLFRESI